MSLQGNGTPRNLALVFALALSAAACQTGPTIRSNVDPSVDFSRYKTYEFLTTTESGKPGYQSFAGQYLTAAITRELEARGFKHQENADVLINFHVQSKDKVQVTQSPGYYGYYGYRGGMYGWGSGVNSATYVDTYTEGTLNVDVVERADHRLIWEGIAVGRINDKTQNNLQPTVDAVVKQVFERFPRQPPGAKPL
jgi:hypothetical protein